MAGKLDIRLPSGTKQLAEAQKGKLSGKISHMASSDALPFTIRVVEGPLSSRVLMAGLDNGLVRLEGRALPYRPLVFEGKQRIKTTFYPGNTVATQQVMGAVEEPTTISGMWKDKYLGQDNARRFVALFETIRNTGSPLLVRWGSSMSNADGTVLHGTEFVRRGLLARTKFTIDRAKDIAWELEFAWASRGEVVAPVISATGVQNPREGFQGLRDECETVVAETDTFFDTVSASLFGFSEATESFFDDRTNSLINLIDTLDTINGASTAVSEIPRATIERGISIATKAANTMQNIADGVRAIPDDLRSVRDDAVELLQSLGARISLFHFCDRGSAVAQDTAAALDGLLFPDILGEEYPPVGSDLRDLAQKYYGDPDLWWMIAQYNGIVGSRVPALPDKASDNPARPIGIPRKQTGSLGDLSKSC